MANADSNVSQQEIKDKLDQSLHQLRGTLAVLVSHPQLTSLDSTLLGYALWNVEQNIKTVESQLSLLIIANE